MNRLQASVLNEITEGAWVIPTLRPLFYQALAEKCKSDDNSVSITQLTLRTYLNIELGPISNFPYCLQPKDFASLENFERLSKQVFATGRPSLMSESERALIVETWNEACRPNAKLSEILRLTFTSAFRISHSGFAGASYPHAFGVYFAGDKFFTLPLAERCLSLIHEMAHQELFLINLTDRLVTHQSDYNLIHAPYQGRLRPPIGRLHSLSAVFRMLQYCETFGGDYQFLKRKFDQTVATFTEGELTSFGESLVDTMECSLKACV